MSRTITRLRRRQRAATLLVATSLTTSLLVAPAIAAPADGVLKGVVTLAGEGVADATVTLTALPGLDAPDGPYRQEPLAVVKTGAAGTFAIPLDIAQPQLSWARGNGNYANYANYANYTVQAFYDDTSIAENLGAISTNLAGLLPDLTATPPATSGLTDALTDLLGLVGEIDVMGCCPVEGLDPDSLAATASAAVALLVELASNPPADVAETIADAQRQIGSLIGQIDAFTEIAAAPRASRTAPATSSTARSSTPGSPIRWTRSRRQSCRLPTP